jgi:hypothetical protein
MDAPCIGGRAIAMRTKYGSAFIRRDHLQRILELPTELPEKIDDDVRGQWLWTKSKLLKSRYHMTRKSLKDWHDKGHAALGSAKLLLETRYARPGKRTGRMSRTYVLTEQLDLIAKFPLQPAQTKLGYSYDQATSKVPKRKLRKYCKSPHPLLKRVIRRWPDHVPGRTRSNRTLRIWRFDKDDVDIITKSRQGELLTQEQGMKRYGLTQHQMQRVKPTRFWTGHMPHHPEWENGWYPEQLQRLKDQLTAEPLLPKPGSPDRVHVDDLGRWWPVADVARHLGLSSPGIVYWGTNGCALLGGRKLAVK